MRTARFSIPRVVVAALVGCILVASGCSSDDDPDEVSASSAAASVSFQQLTGAEIAELFPDWTDIDLNESLDEGERDSPVVCEAGGSPVTGTAVTATTPIEQVVAGTAEARTFSQMVLTFPSADEATAYLDAIAGQQPGCTWTLVSDEQTLDALPDSDPNGAEQMVAVTSHVDDPNDTQLRLFFRSGDRVAFVQLDEPGNSDEEALLTPVVERVVTG